MTDQKLTYSIDGDASGLKKAIAEVQAASRQMTDALTRKVGEIGAFKSAQEELTKFSAALAEAKRKRDFFINSANSGGAAGTKLFAADVARAKQEVLNLAAAMQKQQATLAALSPTLKAAGINTQNLAGADARLASEIRAANAATSAQVVAMQRAQAQSIQTKRSFSDMQTAVGKLRAAFAPLVATLAAGFGVRGLAQAADQYANLQARLKLAARSQEEFNASNDAVQRIASAAQAPLAETAALYTRIANSLKDTDVSQSKFVDTTEAVALALRLSGATVAESQSAMLQFSQAIASGVLRGEELNAVFESAPRLMQALAASLGKPVGELRAMAKAGELTREVLINGLAAELPTLRREAEALPKTLAGAFTEMGNRILLMVGQIDQASGASASLAKSFLELGTPAIRTVFETFALLGANLAFVFKTVGREIGAYAAQINAMLRLDFKGARFIRDAVTADAKAARAELDALEKKILGLGAPKVAAKPMAGKGAISNLTVGKPKKAPADNTDRLGLKSIDVELAILKEALKESESLYDNALKNQEISLEDSQAAKLAIIRRGFDAEIEANNKKLAILSSAKPRDANESRTFAADIADLQAKNVALGNEKAVREKLFADEARRGAVELGKQADAFNADIELQLLRAQGQELAARLREIETARADALAKSGANGGLVNALFDAQGAIAKADEIKRQIDAVFDHARQRADDIKNNAATGALPEQAARNAQIASAQQAAADAQPLIASLKQIIDANPQAFGPTAQAQVDEYGRRLHDIGQVADEVATRINGSISSGFEKLFSDIGTSAATAQDALRTFVLGVVNEINAVVSKQLGQALFASLFPQGNAGGGVGGFFSSILGGKGGGKNDGSTPANAIYTRNATGGGVGGAAPALTGGKDGAGLFAGMFDEIGRFFSSLFASLKSGLSSIVSGIGSALSGLFSGGGGGGGVGGWVSAIASAFGYADGGWTGPGSKYQPAGIVHADEFVFDKVATNRIGVNALENMRRIASGSFVSSRPRIGYADGGLVNLPGSAAPSVTANTKIVNHWDSDAAMSEYLNTRSGERAILNIIQRNPGASRA